VITVLRGRSAATAAKGAHNSSNNAEADSAKNYAHNKSGSRSRSTLGLSSTETINSAAEGTSGAIAVMSAIAIVATAVTVG